MSKSFAAAGVGQWLILLNKCLEELHRLAPLDSASVASECIETPSKRASMRPKSASTAQKRISGY